MIYLGQKDDLTLTPIILQSNRGLSLVELIIAVAIFVFLFTFGLKAFSSLLNQQLLKKASSNVEILLQEAKSKTLSAVDASNYGVYFEPTRVTLFKGTTFVPLDSNNEEIVFDEKINISDISLGGASSVVFEKLTGDADNSGTITISFVSDLSKFRTITIEPTGVISSD